MLGPERMEETGDERGGGLEPARWITHPAAPTTAADGPRPGASGARLAPGIKTRVLQYENIWVVSNVFWCPNQNVTFVDSVRLF